MIGHFENYGAMFCLARGKNKLILFSVLAVCWFSFGGGILRVFLCPGNGLNNQ